MTPCSILAPAQGAKFRGRGEDELLTPIVLLTLLVSTVLGGSRQVSTPLPSTPPAPSASPTAKPSPSPTPASLPTELPAANAVERKIYEALNAERVRQGITPVAWSYELAGAAAQHSADMAHNDFLEHEGSDGSTPRERAGRTGYVLPPGPEWSVIEGISAMPSWDAALDWLLSDGLHRRLLLRPTWREVGIGYVAGGRYGNYWTLDFGCRPNVLPVFSTALADGQSFKLTFSQENCAEAGGGPDQMGLAADVMLSSRRDFRDGKWEPFTDTRQVVGPQSRDLNIRLRDDVGRLSAPVRLVLDTGQLASGAGTASTTTPSPSPTATSQPAATPKPSKNPPPVPTLTPDFFPPLQP